MTYALSVPSKLPQTINQPHGMDGITCMLTSNWNRSGEVRKSYWARASDHAITVYLLYSELARKKHIVEWCWTCSAFFTLPQLPPMTSRTGRVNFHIFRDCQASLCESSRFHKIFTRPTVNFHVFHVFTLYRMWIFMFFTLQGVKSFHVFRDFHVARCEFSRFHIRWCRYLWFLRSPLSILNGFAIFTLQGVRFHAFRDFHVPWGGFCVFTFSRAQTYFRSQIPFLRPNDSNGLRPRFSSPNGSPGLDSSCTLPWLFPGFSLFL